MTQYLLLVHGDTDRTEDLDQWGPYLRRLRASGRFDGGSSIGDGRSFSMSGQPVAVSGTLVGYLVVRAESLDDARTFLAGLPTYEAGGTVEIRELLAD